MLVPMSDAALIVFTLFVLLALCIAAAPTIIAPHEMRLNKMGLHIRPKRTPRAD
jgi:hypothetical protein